MSVKRIWAKNAFGVKKIPSRIIFVKKNNKKIFKRNFKRIYSNKLSRRLQKVSKKRKTFSVRKKSIEQICPRECLSKE